MHTTKQCNEHVTSSNQLIHICAQWLLSQLLPGWQQMWGTISCKKKHPGGAWVAQLLKCLTWFWLRSWSLYCAGHGACLRFLLSLSLCPFPDLSPTKKQTTNKKTLNGKIFLKGLDRVHTLAPVYYMGHMLWLSADLENGFVHRMFHFHYGTPLEWLTETFLLN